MKTGGKKVQAALIALMMLSSAMMMGSCGSADASDRTEEVSGTGETVVEESESVSESESGSETETREYTYEDNRTTYNYNYENNTYEVSGSTDSSSGSSESTATEEPQGDDGYHDQDTEEQHDEGEDSGSGEETGSGEDSTSYGISETDYAYDAYVSTNDFEINPLPTRVGGTNAVIRANVINRSGKHVTGIGCTICYGYGSAIKSTLIRCDCDDGSFGLQFDINEHLQEMLDRGICYSYRIFVEADGKIYTHDPERFETNGVDDRIEIEEQVSSVSTTSASVNVKVYNPTGATVEAIGCRFGDGILLLSEDKVTGSFTDTEFDETFTFCPEDGEFPSGYTYTYEVYVVCNGHEYTIGTDHFDAPLY